MEISYLSPGPDYLLLTTIYRKPIHTDQCCHLDSHHNLSAKYSVFSTLTHMARTVCANPKLLYKEKKQHKGGLKKVQILHSGT